MSDKLSLPISIIIAGLLIGGGIYLNGKITRANPTDNQKQQIKSSSLSDLMRPVGKDDHILGSAKARVLVVEYSDTECPYCKNFHNTMLTLMQEYGQAEKMAWVYRHFPIAELHTKSFKESEALECAGSLGGNSKFWEYTNKIYEITPSNDALDPKELLNVAKQVGLESVAFGACLNSGESAPRVKSDIENAVALGAVGTPYSIIIDTKNNTFYPLEGAYPYTAVKSVIEMILNS